MRQLIIVVELYVERGGRQRLPRPASSAAAAPSISASSFTNDFTSMAQLKSLAAAGKGKIAAILPDTTSSTRYVEFDQPDIKKALLAAGIPASDIIIQNAQKSDQTFLTDAQSDITNGASIILSDPEDSGTGSQVEKYAASHGAKVIDYDRLTLGGSRPYYVSFNNVDGRQGHGSGPHVLCHPRGCQEPAGHRHARRPDRQ